MKRRLLQNKIFTNFLSLSFLQGVSVVIPIITVPYLIRVIGPNYFGLLSFVSALINYFQVLTEYGFNTTATRGIAIFSKDSKKVENFFNDVLSSKLILTLFGIILLTIIICVVPKFKEYWYIYYYTFGLIIGQAITPVWLFQGMQEMKYVTIVSIISRGGGTLLIFLLVSSEKDYWIVPLLNSGGAIIAGLISLYYARIRFSLRFRFSPLESILKQLDNGKYMFLSELKVTLFTNTNLLILGFLKGDIAVGYFSAAEKLVRAIGNLQGPFTNAIYPHISKLMSENIEKAYSLILKITKFGVLISFIVIFICFLFANYIIELFYSESMVNTIIPFQILLLIPLCSFLDNIFGKQVLLNLGKDNVYFNVMLTAALFNLSVNPLLTFYYSFIGTSIALVLTQILIVVGMIYFGIKQIKNKN